MPGERHLKPRNPLQLDPPRVPLALAVLFGASLLLLLQGCAGQQAQPVTLPTAALPAAEHAPDAATAGGQVDPESEDAAEVAANLDPQVADEADEADEANDADDAEPTPEEVVTASPLDELGEFEPDTRGDRHAQD